MRKMSFLARIHVSCRNDIFKKYDIGMLQYIKWTPIYKIFRQSWKNCHRSYKVITYRIFKRIADIFLQKFANTFSKKLLKGIKEIPNVFAACIFKGITEVFPKRIVKETLYFTANCYENARKF